MRCDIVFNNLLASAYTLGKIEILSDGTPWRPVVHVNDVCDAFLCGLIAPPNLVSGKAFNVGIDNGNFTVSDLAKVAQKLVPGSKIVISGEHMDVRTYKVSFKRILSQLNSYFNPKWNLENGGQELINYFKEIRFDEKMFKDRYFNRLNQLEYLQKNNLINSDLRWI